MPPPTEEKPIPDPTPGETSLDTSPDEPDTGPRDADASDHHGGQAMSDEKTTTTETDKTTKVETPAPEPPKKVETETTTTTTEEKP